jgi:hypothetical protein
VEEQVTSSGETLEGKLEPDSDISRALTPISPLSMTDIMSLGQVLVRSGMFRSTTSAEQAVAKILAGREYGLGPVASMTHIYVIDGKVGMSAALIGAKIRQHRDYDFKVERHTDELCEISFTYEGNEAGTSTFTMEDARAAGLVKGRGAWEKYPRNMVYARALTNGARWYCPDVFGGAIYTAEELGARVVFDATGQEIVEGVPEAAPLASISVRVADAGVATPPVASGDAAMLTIANKSSRGPRGLQAITFEPVVLNVVRAERKQLQNGTDYEVYEFTEMLQYIAESGAAQATQNEWRASFEAFTNHRLIHEGFESGISSRGEFVLALRQGRGDSWWQNVVSVKALPELEAADSPEDWPEMPEEGEMPSA